MTLLKKVVSLPRWMTKKDPPPASQKVLLKSHLILTKMARLQGISGGMSGKTGSFTYRQSRGQTIVSQYQPVVKNPNTQGQQEQRAKFKLMSQLAAIMAAGFGTMGVTKRPAKQAPTQRNAFVQLNFPLVNVTTDNAEVTATIPMEQLKLTSSFRYLPNLQLLSYTAPGTEERSIDVLFTSTVPSEVRAVRFITVGYSGNVASIIDMRDVPASELSNVLIPAPIGKYTVLAYGLIPSESANLTIDLDNIHTPADEDFISAVQLNEMVSNGSMVETMTVGANVTVS